MTLNILRYSEAMQQEQMGRASIFSILSLVREQRRLAGRKTVIYFSEGMVVPPNQVDFFHSSWRTPRHRAPMTGNSGVLRSKSPGRGLPCRPATATSPCRLPAAPAL